AACSDVMAREVSGEYTVEVRGDVVVGVLLVAVMERGVAPERNDPILQIVLVVDPVARGIDDLFEVGAVRVFELRDIPEQVRGAPAKASSVGPEAPGSPRRALSDRQAHSARHAERARSEERVPTPSGSRSRA